LLRITLLGAMQAFDAAGRPIAFRARKTRAILALLALAAPQQVLRSQLIALLWSTRDLQQARGSLRQALHELHSALGPLAASLLVADRHQVGLRDSGLEVQSLEPPNRTTEDLAENERLLLLSDLDGIDPAFDAWLFTERAKLKQRGRVRADAALRSASNVDEALVAAKTLLGIDPAHEAAWEALIRSHMAQGDRTSALAAFEECQIALAETARLDPSASVSTLVSEIRADEAPLLRNWLQRSAFGRVAIFEHERHDRLRVAVPLLRVLGDAPASRLAAGLAEELVSALARFRWISCFSVQLPITDILDISGRVRCGPDLDLILDGAVQQHEEQLRVTVRLLDIRAAGEVIWSERFDGTLRSLLTLQDEIASATVARLEPKLLLWEGERARASLRGHPSAHDLLRMAIPDLFRLHRPAFEEAGARLRQALEMEPGHPETYVWLTQWHLFALGQGWTTDIGFAARSAQELASRAIELAPGDARALTLAGHVRAFIDGRPEEARWFHERALSANPNLTLAWSRAAFASAYAGRHEDALREAEQARRLSPDDPLAFLSESALAISNLLLGEYEAAARYGARAITINPRFSTAYKAQLAALGHLGQHDEATEIRGRLLTLEPGFSIGQTLRRLPIRKPEDRARYLDGLRLGGLG
jgi:DNA-binding SARP family transcriptional activator/TolB-like protein